MKIEKWLRLAVVGWRVDPCIPGYTDIREPPKMRADLANFRGVLVQLCDAAGVPQVERWYPEEMVAFVEYQESDQDAWMAYVVHRDGPREYVPAPDPRGRPPSVIG